MLTAAEAKIRVARGAAHLDSARPGWFLQIDVGTLTMNDPCRCIVGQLCDSGFEFVDAAESIFRTHTDGAVHLFHFGIDIHPHDDACEDGIFLTGGVSRAFRILQDAWVAAIADRRLAATATETAPEAVCAT